MAELRAAHVPFAFAPGDKLKDLPKLQDIGRKYAVSRLKEQEATLFHRFLLSAGGSSRTRSKRHVKRSPIDCSRYISSSGLHVTISSYDIRFIVAVARRVRSDSSWSRSGALPSRKRSARIVRIYGPSLVRARLQAISIAMASQRNGSKVILCTVRPPVSLSKVFTVQANGHRLRPPPAW